MFFFLLKQRRFYLLYVGEILSTVSFTEKWQTESHEITHLYSNQTVRRSLCIPEIAKKKNYNWTCAHWQNRGKRAVILKNEKKTFN